MIKSLIEFNFDEALQQSRKIDDVANRLQTLQKNTLGAAREALPTYWQGTSASAFQERQRELQQEILETAKALHQQATTIRAIAQRLYDAEMEAQRTAENRSYRT